MNATAIWEESIAAATAIENPSHPIARRVRDILRAGSSARRTVLIDDEENIVQALRSGVRLESLYFAEHGPVVNEEVLAATISSRIPVHRVSVSTLAAIFGPEKRTRVFALADRPRPRTLADLARMEGDVVVLDGVRLAGNIGAITRSAAALGAAGVILIDSGITSTYDRRLIRASRGLVFSLPVVLSTHQQVADFLRETSIMLVGLAADASAPLAELSEIPGRLALLLGSERAGASEALVALASRHYTIPIDPGIDSLNVSVAGAIALYERGRGTQAHAHP